ncbi:MAG: DUF4872 domain-containing protein [Chloroflexi bacterium]|nr:MAG: DUF4872 domain-containing protein [Chloroflexota bacterium]
MTIQPIPNFRSVNTHHCVTGSMHQIYLFNNHDISEEMLLGLGQGVSFIYWHQKGESPFLGGRGMPKPSMEELAAQRTGVTLQMHKTTSTKKAKRTLLEMLEQQQPVMLQVDMGFLPYFDFGGEEYHFGGHAVVACGYDAATDTVLIADRDGMYPVPMTDLEKARGSTFKPFPPKNMWCTLDFSEKRQPTPEEVQMAICETAVLMLTPPIRNFGVKGIRKAAKMMLKWPELLTPEQLKWTLFNGHIFISAIGGSGGGAFRYMYSRFLRETAVLTSNSNFNDCADEFQQIGDDWELIAERFRELSETADPEKHLGEVAAPLNELAHQEEIAWQHLQSITL